MHPTSGSESSAVPQLQPHERAGFGPPFPLRSGNWGTTRIALSPDGKTLVGCFPHRAANELALINISRMTSVILRHPDERFMLTAPQFSSDGKTIVIVAAPYPYVGTGTLIFYDVSGGPSKTISGIPPRSFSSAAVSPNGRHIAYFRDIVPYPETPRVLPEERSNLWRALFELDLQSGVETRLSGSVWGGGSVWYDAAGTGLYLITGLPLKAVDREGYVWFEEESGFPDWTDPRRAAFNGFWWDRKAEIPDLPDPIVPREAIWDQRTGRLRGGLYGVDRLDRRLFSASNDDETAPNRVGREALLCTQNSVVRTFGEQGARLEMPTNSWDGSAVAACLGTRMENGVQVLAPSEKELEIVYWRNQDARIRFSQSEPRVTETRLLEFGRSLELST